MTTEIRDAYDRWAAQYDSDANTTRDLNADVLREQVFPQPADEVLEIGCGTGLNTQWLTDTGGQVVATDFSEEMLEKAQDCLSGTGVTLRAVDVRKPWPFDENSFDWVVSTLILEHVERLAPVFREAHRVLRTGGRFYLSELHPYQQFEGTQAHFEDETTGETVVIDAFTHPVSAFINAGIEAGFAVEEVGEWRAKDDEQPRLLTIRLNAEPAAARS